MPRLALAALLLLSARALADESCAADGTCQASEDENAALLQRSAAQKVEVTQHSHAITTETKTLTCYPNYAAATCGATMKCFLDTSGCSSSGGGACCKAAGNGAGLQQCKFCGDSTCGPCPGGPAPSPTPTPWPPAPTPNGQGLGQHCGHCGSTGQWQGDCQNGLVCSPVATMMVGSCPTCQWPPANPPGGTLGATCWNSNQCEWQMGLTCVNSHCQGGYE